MLFPHLQACNAVGWKVGVYTLCQRPWVRALALLLAACISGQPLGLSEHSVCRSVTGPGSDLLSWLGGASGTVPGGGFTQGLAHSRCLPSRGKPRLWSQNQEEQYSALK